MYITQVASSTWPTGCSLPTLGLSTWIQLSPKLTAFVPFQLINQCIHLLLKAIGVGVFVNTMEKFLIDSPRCRQEVGFHNGSGGPRETGDNLAQRKPYLIGACSGYLSVYNLQPEAKPPSTHGRRGRVGKHLPEDIDLAPMSS